MLNVPASRTTSNVPWLVNAAMNVKIMMLTKTAAMTCQIVLWVPTLIVIRNTHLYELNILMTIITIILKILLTF